MDLISLPCSSLFSTPPFMIEFEIPADVFDILQERTSSSSLSPSTRESHPVLPMIMQQMGLLDLD
jgi:hypothetical protein